GPGPGGAAAPERRASRHPGSAGGKLADERARAHLPRAARPARPPPDRPEPERGGGRPPDRGPRPGARPPETDPGPAAADRRPRGGQRDARGRDRGPQRGHPHPGRGRAGPGHPPGHSGAAEHRGSGAGPRAAALCPGNHHQCRPPRRRPYPLAEHQPGRPRGQGPGPGRRPRRRARGGPGQRPARHARTTGRLWRPGGYHHRARAGLRARHPTSDGEPRMIRVCLVDDQTLVRQGVKSLLELADGIEVVAEAADGRQALEMIPEVKPDVVLMDMRMPVMSGLEALQALGGKGQLPPTIILTTFDDDQLVLAGIRAGAKGYLLKDVSLDQLVSAIQTVAAGGSLVQPAVTQRLLSGLEGLQNEFVSL